MKYCLKGHACRLNNTTITFTLKKADKRHNSANHMVSCNLVDVVNCVVLKFPADLKVT